jgi:predicted phosphodiesterase
MRVALISDLHANELALEAVLADAARAGIDQLVCLGDVATLGPRPREVLARLRALECRCVMGNHDEFLLDPALVRSYTQVPVIVDAIDWCRAQLSASELDFVRSFVPGVDLDLGGGATLALFHGSPRSHMEDLLATTPPDAVDEMLAGRRGTVMAGGHTHVQMLRQHRGTLLLNPGSVGMPFREYVGGRAPKLMAHAEYAIVSGHGGAIDVQLRRVPLERSALRAQATSVKHPIAPMLAAEYA